MKFFFIFLCAFLMNAYASSEYSDINFQFSAPDCHKIIIAANMDKNGNPSDTYSSWYDFSENGLFSFKIPVKNNHHFYFSVYKTLYEGTPAGVIEIITSCPRSIRGEISPSGNFEVREKYTFAVLDQNERITNISGTCIQKSSQNMEFIKKGSAYETSCYCLAEPGEIHLTVNGQMFKRNFSVSVSPYITLLEYVPPENLSEINISVYNCFNDKLYLVANFDEFCQPSDTYCEPIQFIKNSDNFSLSLSLSPSQYFFSLYSETDLVKVYSVTINREKEHITLNLSEDSARYDYIFQADTLKENMSAQIIVSASADSEDEKYTLVYNNQALTAPAFLYKNIPYNYTLRFKNHDDIRGNFTTGAEEYITLHGYAPPEKTAEVSVILSDKSEQFSDVFLYVNCDNFGNPSLNHQSFKMNFHEGMFTKKLILAADHQFVFSLYEETEKPVKLAKALRMLDYSSVRILFESTADGSCIFTPEYRFFIYDPDKKAQKARLEIFDEKNNSFTQKMYFDTYWKAACILKEKQHYTYNVQFDGFNEVSGKFFTDFYCCIDLFEYSPPENLCKIEISVDDSVQKRFSELYLSGNFNMFGAPSADYLIPIQLQSDNYKFIHNIYLQKDHMYHFVVYSGKSMRIKHPKPIYEFSYQPQKNLNSLEFRIPVLKKAFPVFTVFLSMLLLSLIYSVYKISRLPAMEHPTNLQDKRFFSVFLPFLYMLGIVSIPFLYAHLSPGKCLFFEKHIWTMQTGLYTGNFFLGLYTALVIVACVFIKKTFRFPPFDPLMISIISGVFFFWLKACYHHGDLGFGGTSRQPLSNFSIKLISWMLSFSFRFTAEYSFSICSIFFGIIALYVYTKTVSVLFSDLKMQWTAFFMYITGYGYMQLYFGHLETSSFVCLSVTLFFCISVLYLRTPVNFTWVSIAAFIMFFSHVATLSFMPGILCLYIVYKKPSRKVSATAFFILAVSAVIFVSYFSYLFSIPDSWHSFWYKVFSVLQCIFFIHPFATFLLLTSVFFVKFRNIFSQPAFLFFFSSVCSFAVAMTVANETFDFKTFHTFAGVGIAVCFMAVFMLEKAQISFHIFPVAAAFLIPELLLILQHSGRYPYGKPPSSMLVNETISVTRLNENRWFSRRLQPLIESLIIDLHEPDVYERLRQYTQNFLYYKYRSGAFRTDPDAYRFLKEFEDTLLEHSYGYEILFFMPDVYRIFDGENLGAYYMSLEQMLEEYANCMISGRYNPDPFILALESRNEKMEFTALYLLQLMRILENGLSEKVFPFCQSKDLRIQKYANELLEYSANEEKEFERSE